MKILFTSHKFHPDIGGVESVSSILANALARSGHSVQLITQSIGDKELDTKEYSFRIIRKPSWGQLLSGYRWADLVFQNNLEIRQLWPNIFYRRPLIIALHTWLRTPNGERNLINHIKRLSLCLASTIISCSDAIRADSSLRSIVIGNPYRDDLFRINPRVPRKNSIVFLGRLVSDKGVDLLLRAYASVNRPDWPLTIIGSGPERSSLQKLAAALKIQNCVDFLGALQGEELVAILNEHELMVVPSLWCEPFGLVVLEGMACGCVVLASDGGGLPDAAGSAGLLFKRGDQADLSLKLEKLIQDSDLRSKLRSRAPAHLSQFCQDVISNRYTMEIENLFNGNHKNR